MGCNSSKTAEGNTEDPNKQGGDGAPQGEGAAGEGGDNLTRLEDVEQKEESRTNSPAQSPRIEESSNNEEGAGGEAGGVPNDHEAQPPVDPTDITTDNQPDNDNQGQDVDENNQEMTSQEPEVANEEMASQEPELATEEMTSQEPEVANEDKPEVSDSSPGEGQPVEE